MKAINYRQGLQVINGQIKKSELFNRSLFATRQLAKRQCTWMKKWEGLQCYDLDEIEIASDQLRRILSDHQNNYEEYNRKSKEILELYSTKNLKNISQYRKLLIDLINN